MSCRGCAFEEANDTVASEQSIFGEKKQDYKSCLLVAVNPYVHVPIVQSVDA